jgi:hypothetical protein
MSTSEEAAAALRESVDRNAQQQALTEETRVLLQSWVRNEIGDEMRLAVAEGIRAAMTPQAAREFWSVGLDVLQEQAKNAAGGWVLSGVSGLLKKAGLFMLLGGLVYWIGGWSALAKLGAVLFGEGK